MPREKKYGEHLNDHQVEFAEYFSKKTGVLMIRNVRDITPQLLLNYKTRAKINLDGLKKVQHEIRKVIEEL